MSLRMMIDLFIAVSGIYMAYWAIQMKRTDKLPEMLVGKRFPIARAKDPQGFIRYIYPYTLAVGILLFLAGILGALEIFALYPLASALTSLAPIVLIMAYGALLMRAQRRYLFGVTDKK